ncbi:hypothetical protein WJX72_009890 [[Myrmecia] bisecta]|uniref:Uncharacterized protein n=1 Tax=[Myrmecia] bisecta TaxID=41462 RepID=A0AAW1R8G9_9CHLO
MRNQIPGLFNDLYWHVKNQEGPASPAQPVLPAPSGKPAKRPKRRPVDRKLRKLVDSASALLDLLTEDLFRLQQPAHLLLIFGQSPVRPMEIYELRMSASTPAPEGKGDWSEAACQQREKVANDLTRKVLRALVMRTPDIPEGRASAGPTKLFVMVEAPAGSALPPGFLPKRNFEPKLRKGLQVCIDIGTTPGALRPTRGQQDDVTGNVTADFNCSRRSIGCAAVVEDKFKALIRQALEQYTLSQRNDR